MYIYIYIHIYIYIYIYIYTGFSINGVPPNGLFIRGNPNLKWMIFLVYPYDSGYLQLPPYVQLSDKATCLVMPFPFYPHEISPPHI